MGVRKMCDQGHVLSQCRCLQKHLITVVPCTGDHPNARLASEDDRLRSGVVIPKHRVYLELTGDVSAAVCVCGWRSPTLWFGSLGRATAAWEAQRHWRFHADNPGAWPFPEPVPS